MTQITDRAQTRLAPEVRRQQILDEATRLIARSGFNAVSLADIASECGIRKQTIAHYFPSTNDLLAAVLEQRDRREYASAVLPSELHSPGSLAAYLRKVVEHNLEMREMLRLYAVLRTEAINPSHPAHAYFAAREKQAVAALTDVLEWKSHPEWAARELLSFWNGLEVQWIWDSSVDFLAIWEEFAARFFRL